MTVCRNEAMNKGGAYPKSCPTCQFGPCSRRVFPDPELGIEAKYYIEVAPSMPVVSDKYAVIYKDTVYHEGDERSRTNPGHGYPAYTETIEKIQTFENEAGLKAWILSNNSGYSRKSYKAIKYRELKVAAEINITLD